jgi:AmiR/NasT family two-component response regulator
MLTAPADLRQGFCQISDIGGLTALLKPYASDELITQIGMTLIDSKNQSWLKRQLHKLKREIESLDKEVEE